MDPWHSLSDHERSLRSRIDEGRDLAVLGLSPTWLEELRRAPINPDSILYRTYALALARGGNVRGALALYLPFLAVAVRRRETRPNWYGWERVESQAEALGQSQRFSQPAEEIDREWRRITAALQLAPADRVLDVGAAGGLFTLRFAPRVASVVATDVSEKLVAAAQARLGAFGNVRCLRHDVTAEALPEVFDKALMASVTPVLPSPGRFTDALRNLATMLRPGGRCFISNNYDMGSAEDAARHLLSSSPTSVMGMYMMESMLWLDPEASCEEARAAGFASAEAKNFQTLPALSRRFDLVLVR